MIQHVAYSFLLNKKESGEGFSVQDLFQPSDCYPNASFVSDPAGGTHTYSTNVLLCHYYCACED